MFCFLEKTATILETTVTHTSLTQPNDTTQSFGIHSALLWKTEVNVNKSGAADTGPRVEETGAVMTPATFRGMYASHSSVPFQDGHQRGQTSWSIQGCKHDKRSLCHGRRNTHDFGNIDRALSVNLLKVKRTKRNAN